MFLNEVFFFNEIFLKIFWSSRFLSLKMEHFEEWSMSCQEGTSKN